MWRCTTCFVPAGRLLLNGLIWVVRLNSEIEAMLLVLACGTRERRGPNRKAIGEVRALCRQSALIYPILLRFASQDRPLSSPASQEKTLAACVNAEPPWCQSVSKAK